MDQLPQPSIDDNISEKSLSISRVQDNFGRLQKHVINKFSKLNNRPLVSIMATANRVNHVFSTLSERHDSVNEDDLFGEGSLENRNEESEVSIEIREAGIPNFSLLDFPIESLATSNYPDQISTEYQGDFESSSNLGRSGETQEGNSSFKDVFRSGPSMSAIERRQRYSTGPDEEVFHESHDTSESVGEGNMSSCGSEGNDLPDVILTSSGSLSSNSFPDVTENHECLDVSEPEKMIKQNEHSDTSTVREQKFVRKQALRSVSINEAENRYIESEEVNSETHVQRVRQDRWSKSSGYCTGESDLGSQDSQTQTLQSETREVWVSGESAVVEDDEISVGLEFPDSMNFNLAGNLVNLEMVESLRKNNLNDERVSRDMENFHSREESVRSNRTCAQDESSDEHRSSLDSLHTFVNAIFSMTINQVSNGGANEMLRLNSNDTYDRVYANEPNSAGNMPTIVTEESFSIQSAQIQQLQDEIVTHLHKMLLNGLPGQPESLSPETPLSQETQNYAVS